MSIISDLASLSKRQLFRASPLMLFVLAACMPPPGPDGPEGRSSLKGATYVECRPLGDDSNAPQSCSLPGPVAAALAQASGTETEGEQIRFVSYTTIDGQRQEFLAPTGDNEVRVLEPVKLSAEELEIVESAAKILSSEPPDSGLEVQSFQLTLDSFASGSGWVLRCVYIGGVKYCAWVWQP